MDEITYRPNGDAATFSGPSAVAVFQMAVLASGLRLYAKTGMRPNRAYTPKAMLETAGALLGWDAVTIRRAIKARDYLGTADVLTAKVQLEKSRIAAAAAEVNR